MTWMGTAVRAAVGAAWRHRWTYAVPVATLLLPATLYAVRQPDQFRARAVVFVRPLEGGGSGGMLPQERAAQNYEMVQTSRDRLLTNANAGPVVPLLYPGHAPADPWALGAVKGRVLWDRAGDSAFAVSMDDTDPQVAAKAVNALLKSFQENERAEKVVLAEGPLRSLERQLAVAREDQDKARRALDAFRTVHAEVLPEQESPITQELAQVRSEITWQDQSASALRARAQFLGEQITRWGSTGAESTNRRVSAEEDKLKAQLDQQQKAVDDARKALVVELSGKTEKHKDVQMLRRQIEVLEADVKATVVALDGARKAARAAAAAEQQKETRGVVDDLKSMRTQTEQEELRCIEASKELRERMKALQSRLARIPTVKPEYGKLQGDADEAGRSVGRIEVLVANARAHVEYLQAMSANDVTGYRIEEWAVPPVLPSGPARWKYLAVALGLGLVIGYGVRSLRKRYEQPPVARPQELRELLPGALVVSVPLLPEGRRVRRGVPVRELALGLWVLVAVGTSALALAARKGIVHPPEWLRPIVGGRA